MAVPDDYEPRQLERCSGRAAGHPASRSWRCAGLDVVASWRVGSAAQVALRDVVAVSRPPKRETQRSLETTGDAHGLRVRRDESPGEKRTCEAHSTGSAENALLWLALRDPTEEEVAAVQEAFELSDEQAHRLLEQPSRASLVDAGEHMHVTLYAASGEEGEPVLRPVECVLGRELGGHSSSRRRSRCSRSSASAPKGEVRSVRSTHLRLSQRLSSGS